jgi:hypothetical protein
LTEQEISTPHVVFGGDASSLRVAVDALKKFRVVLGGIYDEDGGKRTSVTATHNSRL